jgi:hypothetical protein
MSVTFTIKKGMAKNCNCWPFCGCLLCYGCTGVSQSGGYWRYSHPEQERRATLTPNERRATCASTSSTEWSSQPSHRAGLNVHKEVGKAKLYCLAPGDPPEKEK